MATNLFVGGLSWGTDDGALRDAFEAFGTVDDAQVVTDRETGRSRGVGFVTFAEGKSSDAAIAAMDGNQLDGRNIIVNEARAREPRGNAGGGGGGGYGRRY